MNQEHVPRAQAAPEHEPAEPLQASRVSSVLTGSPSLYAAGAAAGSPHSGIAFLRAAEPPPRRTVTAPAQAKRLLRDSHLLAPLASPRSLGRPEAGVRQMQMSPGRVIQMATAITHQTGKLKVGPGSYTVGLGMKAVLDPDDPVVGSATGPNWDWMKALRASYPDAGVVRGHLLNHDLGGYAVPENLYPISTKANANHSSLVEQNVKAALTAAHGKSAPKPIINYQVIVKEFDPPKTVEFRCAWNDAEGKKYNVEVPSDLVGHSGGWGGKGGKTSPASWQHKSRRGPLDFAQLVAAKNPKITVTGDKGAVGVETDYPAFVQAVLNAFDIEEDIDDLESVAAIVSKVKPEKVAAALTELGFTVKVRK